MSKLPLKSSNWLVRMGKKHAWWIVSVFGFGATSISYWVANVNATQTTVIELKTIVPEVRRQMADTNTKLDTIDKRTHDMNQRLANIEGRIKK